MSSLSLAISTAMWGVRPVTVARPGQTPAAPLLADELPLRILLAEDNVVNQKVALRLLERLGYRADLAANGLEVLDAIKRQRYDLVLMDVQMPEMDGLEATRRLVEMIPEKKRPRIVAMTASALNDDHLRCFEAGMDDFVSKPVQFDALVDALRRCASKTFEEAETFAEELGLPSDVELDSLGIELPTIDDTALDYFRSTLCNGDEAIADELVGSYLDNAHDLVVQMEAAFHLDDSPALRRHAHTLKSSSQMFGAARLAALCARLEHAPTPTSDHLRVIDLELAAVLAALRPASEEDAPGNRPAQPLSTRPAPQLSAASARNAHA